MMKRRAPHALRLGKGASDGNDPQGEVGGISEARRPSGARSREPCLRTGLLGPGRGHAVVHCLSPRPALRALALSPGWRNALLRHSRDHLPACPPAFCVGGRHRQRREPVQGFRSVQPGGVARDSVCPSPRDGDRRVLGLAGAPLAAGSQLARSKRPRSLQSRAPASFRPVTSPSVARLIPVRWLWRRVVPRERQPLRRGGPSSGEAVNDRCLHHR